MQMVVKKKRRRGKGKTGSNNVGAAMLHLSAFAANPNSTK